MKKVVKFESKPKAEKKGFVVKTAVKAGYTPPPGFVEMTPEELKELQRQINRDNSGMNPIFREQ